MMSNSSYLEPQLPPHFYQSRGARRGGGGDAGHREGPGRGRAVEEDPAETFTRWCNEHLKCVNKRIVDLQKDLSDGLKLIGLLEVLSQKKMYRKYHSRPNFRQMKLENVSVALEFLEREHIKLVSIAAVAELSCPAINHPNPPRDPRPPSRPRGPPSPLQASWTPVPPPGLVDPRPPSSCSHNI
ncbi:Filamin-C [Collichthys lucidus]|uniref:Filamin-C n=1 Tax=Collichthys lucidus TaxID=240159 RepID=A0A4U5VPB7_COLLU|nr:Filamin-C [Collichthys lucidus]